MPPSTALSLFDIEEQVLPGSAVAEAEKVLLDLADHAYAQTSLKPMSKVLFLLSRCLLVASVDELTSSANGLSRAYTRARKLIQPTSLEDDYSFRSTVRECGDHIERVVEAVREVHRLIQGSDALGLAFSTLLRGKFESGEGLGTFLTPEEVVSPTVSMLLHSAGAATIERINAGPDSLLFGDVCGGTGRFVYDLAQGLRRQGISQEAVSEGARLFDQSRQAVDFARLNFLFAGLRPRFAAVQDSLTDPSVSGLRGRFGLLATNPPFGTAKYQWSRALKTALGADLLDALGLRGAGSSADPSELFLYRNLDLLAPGGVLAIVLPDGVVQSTRFQSRLRTYETLRDTRISLIGLVSLPSVTFSLGGTVAKTSVLLLGRDTKGNQRTYVAEASHVGYLKRGNKRAPDPEGNDLDVAARDFVAFEEHLGRFVDAVDRAPRLVASRLLHQATPAERQEGSAAATGLASLVSFLRDTAPASPPHGEEWLHVSILDVDETGLIDVAQAARNRPITRGLCCQPGDLLLSCLNPKIWRVAVIPRLDGYWTCSPEFVVMRPNDPDSAWHLALSMGHREFRAQVQALAGGTSSSRQRVRRAAIQDVSIRVLNLPEEAVQTHFKFREDWYRRRLWESRAFDGLASGSKADWLA